MTYNEFDENAKAVKLANSVNNYLLPELLATMHVDAANQDATVGNIRSRAAGILSTAALVVALGTTLGAIKIGSNGTGVQLDWVATTVLLLTAFAIGVLTTLIQWPRLWVFSSGTNVYADVEPDTARRAAIATLEQGIARNTYNIAKLLRLFTASFILLGLEVAVILGDVLIHLVFQF